MTWAMAAQLLGAFLLGALWMYRRQRRQIRLIAEFLARANAELADDLFTSALHDDPDEDFTYYAVPIEQTMPPGNPEWN